MSNQYGFGRRRMLAAAMGTAALGVVGAPTRAAAQSTGPYRYPIVPGTPQWAQLKSQSEMIEATRLPDGLAERMSTPDLVATVLTYPLLTHALAGDQPSAGLQAVIGHCGAAQELLHRTDAVAVLVDHYGVSISAFRPGPRPRRPAIPRATSANTFADL